MNKLNENELEKKILEGYNESQDLRDFVEEKKRGKGIKWSEENKPEKWTKMTKDVFMKIGKKRGYKIEDTERNKEFMGLDQVWFNKKNDEAVLALETENSAGFQTIVKDEFRKLLNFKSDYKILIWYNYDEDDEDSNLDEFQEKVDDHPKVLKNEVFFIIRVWHDEERVMGITICKLKKGEKREEKNNFQVYDIENDEEGVKKYKERKEA